MPVTRIAVLASGYGSNLQALMDGCAAGELRARIACVVSDKERARALQRARDAGVPAFFVDPQRFADKAAYESEIVSVLRRHRADVVALAGYMRIVGPVLLGAYPGKIFNIHPSLLPAFPGLDAIRQAFEYGVKVTGVTVHFIDEGVDTGPVILQEPVVVEADDTLETLEAKIHRVEHEMYKRALSLYIDGRLQIEGRKVLVK